MPLDQCYNGICFSFVEQKGLFQDVTVTVAQEMCKRTGKSLANINRTLAETLRNRKCDNGANKDTNQYFAYYTGLTYHQVTYI